MTRAVEQSKSAKIPYHRNFSPSPITKAMASSTQRSRLPIMLFSTTTQGVHSKCRSGAGNPNIRPCTFFIRLGFIVTGLQVHSSKAVTKLSAECLFQSSIQAIIASSYHQSISSSHPSSSCSRNGRSHLAQDAEEAQAESE